MIIIGEKINGTRKAVAKAVNERDADFIKKLAERQDRAGSDYLDLNAGSPPHREPEDMVWLVENAQQASDLPLCLDSANPAALKACLEMIGKTPLINSLSGERARIEGVLPLALEYKTGLIILALDDETGIPKTSDKRMEIIHKLAGMAIEGGLAEEQLFIDPPCNGHRHRHRKCLDHLRYDPSGEERLSQGTCYQRFEQHILRHACQALDQPGFHGNVRDDRSGQRHCRP